MSVDVNPTIRLIPAQKYINTMLPMDEQIILQNTKEDDWQLTNHCLCHICKNYNLQILEKKTKVAFQGKWPVNFRLVVNGQSTELVSHLTS